MTSTPNPSEGPDPIREPGKHRLHARLGTTRRELTGQAGGSPAHLTLATLISDMARDADTLADMLRSRIGQARDELARLSAGGRPATSRGTTVMAALGAEIDLITAQLDQSLGHLDRLIDAYQNLKRHTPTADLGRLRLVPGQRRNRATRPCPCACTRPCGCGHAGCTAP
ncbi:hypothetical protein [Streptacidiphilus neutrinimicus]|uniref:hypothetical protein n=1 Tax=Streptacidiphilus neutrinimicus TaxID=105420 RepID=UPI0005AB4FA7|nr:hypothetical protein [Streptacidiphilus neutrinimicus]